MLPVHRLSCSVLAEAITGSLARGIWGVIMGASLYEPINVYKPVAPDIGIIDGSLEYLTVAGIRLPLPFTTRMTTTPA